jgi:hypothetical protein
VVEEEFGIHLAAFRIGKRYVSVLLVGLSLPISQRGKSLIFCSTRELAADQISKNE